MSDSYVAVTVHGNSEVTVLDERGDGVACKNCKFSGWRSNAEYRDYNFPPRCLHYSGGGDPQDGDRILDSLTFRDGQWRGNGDTVAEMNNRYPHCIHRNHDGKCETFVRAKPLPWWNPLRWVRREYRTRSKRS